MQRSVDTTRLAGEARNAKVKEALQLALQHHHISYDENIVAILAALFDKDSNEKKAGDFANNPFILSFVEKNKDRINTYINDQQTLHELQDQIAEALYKAASDYYQATLEDYINKPEALSSEIEKFNVAFVDIAVIDDNNHSLSSIDRCRELFRTLSLRKIEDHISKLQNRSYIHSGLKKTAHGREYDAINFINERLNEAGFSDTEQVRQYIYDHKFTFSKAFRNQYTKLDTSELLIQNFPMHGEDGLIKIYQRVDFAEREAAESLHKADDAQKPGPDKPKHTGVKAGLGIGATLLIGGAVVVGLAASVVFPLALPVIIGIGLSALAVFALSIVIGKAIDLWRNKKAAHKVETLPTESKTEETETDEKAYSRIIGILNNLEKKLAEPENNKQPTSGATNAKSSQLGQFKKDLAPKVKGKDELRNESSPSRTRNGKQ